MEGPLDIHSILFGPRNHNVFQDLFQMKFDINFNSLLDKNQLILAEIRYSTSHHHGLSEESFFNLDGSWRFLRQKFTLVLRISE
ncbi:hypothetical protein Y032_0541g3202 [Ancylostoma ceylanicum]|nr:hypothetical protein Y032_0541g3202 [Ancylostoma ceylanicum]